MLELLRYSEQCVNKKGIHTYIHTRYLQWPKVKKTARPLNGVNAWKLEHENRKVLRRFRKNRFFPFAYTLYLVKLVGMHRKKSSWS